MNKIPLRELGTRLASNTNRDGAFAFKRWTLGLERQIAKDLLALPASANSFAPMRVVLENALLHYNGQSFDGSVPQAERRLAIEKAWFSDLLVAWLQCRREALGDELVFTVLCHRCKAELEDVQANLGDIVVNVTDDPHDMSWSVDLRDGIPVFGKIGKHVIMQPMRWSAYASATREELATGEAIVRGSVAQIEGAPSPLILMPSDLAEISKYDLELLLAAANEQSIGPELVVSLDCPHCHATDLKYPIDWEYEGFFGSSSRFRHVRNSTP